MAGARDELIKEHTEKKEQLATLLSEHQLLQNKLIHQEKLNYALKESSHALQKQLNEIKTNTEQQIVFITQQFNKSENQLKNQLKENTQKYKKDIEQLEFNQKNEINRLHKQIDKHIEQIHNTELQLQNKNTELDKLISNHNKITKQNEDLENQFIIQNYQINSLKK